MPVKSDFPKKLSSLVLLVTILLSTRLPNIGSGLNVMEPDEWDYQHIAQSLSYSAWPTWHGELFLSKYPAFIFLGYWIGKSFPWLFTLGPYVNLRLVSVIADLGLLITLFYILRHLRFDLKIIVPTLILFLFIPLHWFYARSGTYEIWYNFFAALFFLAFLKWQEKPTIHKSVSTGSTFTLAVLAKHINILLGPVFLVYLHQHRHAVRSYVKPLITVAVSAIVTLIIALLPLLNNPQKFYVQYVSLYRDFFVFHPKAFIFIWWEYIKLFSYWLSLPVVVFAFLGFHLILKRPASHLYLITVLLVDLFYLGIYYINPRSFIILLPWLTILVAFGIRHISILLKLNSLVWPIIIASVLLTINQGLVAYHSTLHTAYESTLSLVNQLKSTYPHLSVYDAVQTKKTAASLTAYEVKLPSANATQSAIVMTDTLHAPLMLNLTEPEYEGSRLD